MSKEQSVAAAALPGYEQPNVIEDAVIRNETKDKIYKLVKRLFIATSTTEKVMEGIGNRMKSADARTSKIAALRESLTNKITAYEQNNSKLRSVYESARKDILAKMKEGLS
jgi:hypothetical protein